MSLARLEEWARRIRRDAFALALALRHPRVPWYAKALAAGIVAYAASPIDLIPDFIPVLGLLDEAVLLPLGILLVARLIPADLMAELRAEAERRPSLPGGWIAAAIVAGCWLALLATAWSCFASW